MPSSNVLRRPDLQSTAFVVRRRDKGGSEGTEEPSESERLSEQARRLLEQASQQAGQLLTQARQDAERIKEQARQQGYEEGRAEAERNLGESARALAELASRARIDVDGLITRTEAQVVELAVVIARKIVERELITDPTTILPMVQAALHEVADAFSVRVRVRPDAVQLVREHLDADVEVLADPELGPGDCVVETPNGMVDGQVEAKVVEITEALRGVGKW